ncbi:MAG: lauroyl acyltransferase [Pseudomonadota bacterium]
MTDIPGTLGTLRDALIDVTARSLIGLARLLPYRVRVPFVGWIFAYVLAPVAGYRKRIRENLALVLPDLPESEVRHLLRAVPDNVGRTMIEIYSASEFVDRIRRIDLAGPGVASLEDAHRTGRPVILASGHFGNYDAARACLIARGYRLGALYRPMTNTLFNEHYVRAIEEIGKPMFPRGRRGMGQMVKFLRSGGMLGILMDQHMGRGAKLKFFGHTAYTATSAADLALKHDALLIPIYAIRLENGLDFGIMVNNPIPHSDPVTMTQAINDDLEDQVRSHLRQWFWIHRRWKGDRT